MAKVKEDFLSYGYGGQEGFFLFKDAPLPLLKQIKAKHPQYFEADEELPVVTNTNTDTNTDKQKKVVGKQ